jgi:hypothetical protein
MNDFRDPPAQDGDPGWLPNTTYVFKPPISADGIPNHSPRLCKVQVLNFNRGFYLGFIEGNHVFMGTPFLDPRQLPDDKRECFFYVTPANFGSRMKAET